MKQQGLVFVWLLVLMATPLAWAEDHPKAPETSFEKESYSIGYQLGLSIRNDEIEVDFDQLVQGLHTAIEGKDPRLEIPDMRRMIVELRKRSRENALKRMQELAVRNAQESERFLIENGKKESIQTTSSGLQYTVLTPGNGISPGPEDTVRVNYRGTFIDGTEFDSSYNKGEPQTVQTDGVIKGWTEALQMMKAGAKWQIFVPPHLAYGRSGLGKKIEPNKVLVFEIELLSVDRKKQE